MLSKNTFIKERVKITVFLSLNRNNTGGKNKCKLPLPTRWTWVWVNSGSWWWTGRPGVMQFMGSQRVRHDWAELNSFILGLPNSITSSNKTYKTDNYRSSWSSFLHISNLIIYNMSHNLKVRYALVKVKVLVAQLYHTLCNPMDCSPQAPLTMEFSRQEYWSGLPFPSPMLCYQHMN